MKTLNIVILLLALLTASACALAEQSNEADVEAAATETAEVHLTNSCEEGASVSVVRADRAHGGAWLVYLDMECSNTQSRYLVYVSADGQRVLNHHVVARTDFEQ